MKRATLILAILLLALGALFAQSGDDYDMEMVTTQAPEQPVSVYFGIYVDDLDYPTAHELGYKYLYGILVTGVSKGSPADKAGLKENDIMMEIDSKPVTNMEEFDRQRSMMRPGQKINLRIWRNVEITDLELVLEPRPEGGKRFGSVISKDAYLEDPTDRPSRKKDLGWGGGGWVPYYTILPMEHVNGLLNSIGDNETQNNDFGFNPISSKGIFMNGGAGKGNIGKGFFLGGVGAGYEFSDVDPVTHASVRYEASFGGLTLDKRFLITDGFAASLGAMFGAGGHTVYYTQTQSEFTWPQIFTENNFTATLKREYFIIQPRAELILNLIPWLSLRAEVGYFCGIPTYNGWKVHSDAGDDITISGSPDTKFRGLSFSIGPWFGF